MKKSLIALAVAGVVSAPAFAATSNVDVYGVMNIAIQDTDVAGSDMTILDNTSRIGFKGSEDLGGGLKAIWQIESGLGGNGAVIGNNGCTSTNAIAGSGAGPDGILGNADDVAATVPLAVTTTTSCNNAGFGTRNTFVGLAGDFGTALMGRHDTPYKLGTASLDIFGDTIADYNLGRTGQSIVNNTHDHRNGSALAYISPTFSGFHAAVAVVMNNGESGSALSNGSAIDATSMTGVYANGPLFASLSYQNAKVASSKATKLGLGYTMGDAKVGFVWESVNNAGAGTDTKAWLLNGAYNMGPIALKAQYGVNNNGAAKNGDVWALGADYNMSKRTAAYVVYSAGDNGAPAGDIAGWNLGVKHSF
jgi:predicted porin